MKRAPILRASIPLELFKAVKVAAQDANVSMSAFVRGAVIEKIGLRMVVLQDRAATESIAQSLRTIALISLLRAGITGDSTAGRLHNRHRRAAYARYCALCNRSGAIRAPYADWCAHNIVLPPRSNDLRNNAQ